MALLGYTSLYTDHAVFKMSEKNTNMIREFFYEGQLSDVWQINSKVYHICNSHKLITLVCDAKQGNTVTL